MSSNNLEQTVAPTTNEDWIDHEFLFHNEHVKKIGPNTVSISTGNLTKKILRPGKGDYPLPKAMCTVEIIAKVVENGKVYQNSRDPAQQEQFMEDVRQTIYKRQTGERLAKYEKDLKKEYESCGKTMPKLRIDEQTGFAIIEILDDDDEDIKKFKHRALDEQTKHEKDVQEMRDTDERWKLYIQPTTFQLGAKEVMRGIELAVATMRVGELAIINIPPELAYTDLGIEDFIPDKAAIELEMELVATEAAAVQIYPGVMKKYIKKGEGWSTPEYNTTCQIFIEGSYAVHDDAVKTEDDVTQMGLQKINIIEETTKDKRDDGLVPRTSKQREYITKQFLKRSEHALEARIDDVLLPEGLEACLKTMKRGEIALFEINKNILIGNGFEPKRHCCKLPIPTTIPSTKNQILGTDGKPAIVDGDDDEHDDLVVFYLIEMVDLKHHVDIWSLRMPERITEAERIKEIGNEFLRLGIQNNQIVDVPHDYTMKFTIGYFQRAIQRYNHCLELFEHFAEYEQKQCTYDQVMRVIGVQLACLNNLQIIYMKYKDYKNTLKSATRALELLQTPVEIYQQIYDNEEDAKLTDKEREEKLKKLEQEEINKKNNDNNDPEAYQPPVLSSKSRSMGKSFAPQTKTNNIYKTLYRKAQALLLQNDPEAAKETLNVCQTIWSEKQQFATWLKTNNIDLSNPNQQITSLYKEQPLLNNNIVPIKYENTEKNEEQLYPVNFDVVTEDIKKEIDKLQILVDKKCKSSGQKAKNAFAKAFRD